MLVLTAQEDIDDVLDSIRASSGLVQAHHVKGTYNLIAEFDVHAHTDIPMILAKIGDQVQTLTLLTRVDD